MLTGHQLDVDLEPGSPEWLQTVSASQIATIVGLTPPQWETPFSLWMKKQGRMPAPAQTDAQGRGHEFEPLIRRWYAVAHPEFDVATTGTWQHNLRTWQTANPDALIYEGRNDENRSEEPAALLEIKTANDLRDWNDGVPDYYQCQAQWQMDTLGVDTVIFAVCGPFELFDRRPKEYVIEYDPQSAARLREAALRFTESLELDIAPDEDLATEPDRLAIRFQHPTVSDTPPVDVPDEIAIPYLTALSETKRIDGDKARWSAEVAKFVGDGKAAAWNGTTLGTRRNGKGDNPPTFAASKGLADKAAELLNPKEEGSRDAA